MTLIFWHNIVSPHQFPYQQALSEFNEVDEVIIVSHTNVTVQRQNMGWKQNMLKNSTKLSIFINPNESEIEYFFRKYNCQNHFFGGIRLNPMVHLAFKVSLKFNVKRHLIAEGPFTYRKPVFLHLVKTYLLYSNYFKYIDKVYAIGSQAIAWYPRFGFNSNKIMPFIYVVDQIKNDFNYEHSNNLKLLFVGQLINRKGVDLLIKALSKADKEFELDIIGDGHERDKLMKLTNMLGLEERIKFKGTKTNADIRKTFCAYDILILPSRHDGWGAVINEALMSGLFVICSDNCGAKELIQNEKNGLIFNSNKPESLINTLNNCIKNKMFIRESRMKIKNWSINISAQVVAKYLLTTLDSDVQPILPWKNKI